MYLILDTETTGLSLDDEILEIAVCTENGEPVFETFVKPTFKTDWIDAQLIHGITYDDVKDAPDKTYVFNKIKQICKGKVPLFYNAAYDMRYIPSSIFDYDPVCVMLLWSEFKAEPSTRGLGYRWHKLTDAAAEVGHVWTGASHRAMSDAQATASVWRHLRCRSLPFS